MATEYDSYGFPIEEHIEECKAAQLRHQSQARARRAPPAVPTLPVAQKIDARPAPFCAGAAAAAEGVGRADARRGLRRVPAADGADGEGEGAAQEDGARGRAGGAAAAGVALPGGRVGEALGPGGRRLLRAAARERRPAGAPRARAAGDAALDGGGRRRDSVRADQHARADREGRRPHLPGPPHLHPLGRRPGAAPPRPPRVLRRAQPAHRLLPGHEFRRGDAAPRDVDGGGRVLDVPAHDGAAAPRRLLHRRPHRRAHRLAGAHHADEGASALAARALRGERRAPAAADRDDAVVHRALRLLAADRVAHAAVGLLLLRGPQEQEQDLLPRRAHPLQAPREGAQAARRRPGERSSGAIRAQFWRNCGAILRNSSHCFLLRCRR